MNPTQEQKDALIKELGIEALPEDAQDEVLAALGEDILKQILLDIFDRVPASSQEKIKGALDGSVDIDTLLTELEAEVEHFDTTVEVASKKCVAEFKDMLAEDTADFAKLNEEEARIESEGFPSKE